MSDWAQEKTGRTLFPYMPKPNKADPINELKRKDQVTIFRLRTQHVPLNHHFNRFNPMHEPHCPMCDFAYETTEHFLFECPKLLDLLLSPKLPVRDGNFLAPDFAVDPDNSGRTRLL